jgi:hypothetical protein
MVGTMNEPGSNDDCIKVSTQAGNVVVNKVKLFEGIDNALDLRPTIS